MTSSDYNLLTTLLQIEDQNRCLRLVTEVLCEFYDDEIGDFRVRHNPKFTYAPGDIPVMLVAHCDTVCYQPVMRIGACTANDGVSTAITNMDQAPLGADDRAGIFIILKLIAAGYRPHILLTTDEEIGGGGALAAAEKIPVPDIKFILELDRMGSNDAAMYDCDNKEFKDMLRGYGFTPVSGTFSDICFFAPDWDIAAANLSVGYYHEHTPWEMLVIKEMENTIKVVMQILDNVDNFPYYKFEPCEYKPSYYQHYFYDGDDWDYKGAMDDINFRAEMSYIAHKEITKKKKKKKKKQEDSHNGKRSNR